MDVAVPAAVDVLAISILPEVMANVVVFKSEASCSETVISAWSSAAAMATWTFTAMPMVDVLAGGWPFRICGFPT